jgi:hypothetical protein
MARRSVPIIPALLPAERQFLEHAFQLGDNGKLKYSECRARKRAARPRLQR